MVDHVGLMVPVDVAIACCWADSSERELYPDLDARPLQEAFEDLGATVRRIAWDDTSVDWASMSKVVVSSTWDSVDRPSEYLSWVREVSSHTTLVNSARVLEWGLDKRHQRDLEVAGIPIVPTRWIERGDSWTLPLDEPFVVKPSISAGGRSTSLHDRGSSGAAAQHVETLLSAGQAVMIQQYQRSIETDGELDLVFIGGQFTHAVHKNPVLRLGEAAGERPWERMSWNGLAKPSADELQVGEATISAVVDLLQECPAYGRVDLVRAADGGPLLLEVEVVDPYLSLDLVPGAAEKLARSVLSERG